MIYHTSTTTPNHHVQAPVPPVECTLLSWFCDRGVILSMSKPPQTWGIGLSEFQVPGRQIKSAKTRSPFPDADATPCSVTVQLLTTRSVEPPPVSRTHVTRSEDSTCGTSTLGNCLCDVFNRLEKHCRVLFFVAVSTFHFNPCPVELCSAGCSSKHADTPDPRPAAPGTPTFAAPLPRRWPPWFLGGTIMSGVKTICPNIQILQIVKIQGSRMSRFPKILGGGVR